MALYSNLNLDLFCRAQLLFVFAKNASIIILYIYANFVDIFYPKFTVELLEYNKINNHPIDLVDS